MEAHDAASVQERFVLLGDPGSGKSSFLRHLALCLAGELRRRHGDEGVPENASLNALRDWLLGAYTPVYVELRDLVRHAFPALPADAEQPRPCLRVTISGSTCASRRWATTCLRCRERLQQLFASGQAILLLDGLDEVPRERTSAGAVRSSPWWLHWSQPIRACALSSPAAPTPIVVGIGPWTVSVAPNCGRCHWIGCMSWLWHSLPGSDGRSIPSGQ